MEQQKANRKGGIWLLLLSLAAATMLSLSLDPGHSPWQPPLSLLSSPSSSSLLPTFPPRSKSARPPSERPGSSPPSTTTTSSPSEAASSTPVVASISSWNTSTAACSTTWRRALRAWATPARALCCGSWPVGWRICTRGAWCTGTSNRKTSSSLREELW